MPPSTTPLAVTLREAAAAAASGQQYPAGALYLVATPIGNLADLTLRAIHVLGLVDAVACEDTRVTGALLRHLGLDARPRIALHAHNERAGAAAVVERLARGERVAYVSDAGTPAISDPGAALVEAVAAAGHRVLPIPGPSSAAAALSVAGDTHAHAGFRFLGFLPAAAGERAAALRRLADSGAADPASVVLFEAPHRVGALAAALAQALPARRVTVCRELTKQFETVATMAAAALPGWLADDANRRRGEFVLVLHASAHQPSAAAGDAHALAAPARHALAELVAAGLPLKQAVALAASISGAPRNALYAQALAWRREADAER